MNLILAVVYQNYGDAVKETVFKEIRFRRQTLTEAFNLLRGDKDTVAFPAFLKVMNHSHIRFSPDLVRFIFHILDKDNDNLLSNPFVLLWLTFI